MPLCLFASDLHGRVDRYESLFAVIKDERPAAVFLGGDLLPGLSQYLAHREDEPGNFVTDYLASEFEDIRRVLGPGYPGVFLILGNDDPRVDERLFLDAENLGLWSYLHSRRIAFAGLRIYGYNCVPPTPFLLKDWERYDVSRYMDPGCVSPEEGWRSIPADLNEVKWATIAKDLSTLVNHDPMERAILLLHTPPYDTPLDRAALDGKTYEHVPLDVHVGSIAVRRFIEERQPLLSLHGHVHESTKLTGEWKARIGRTVCINAAHDGPELALVRFDSESPDGATRELIR